MADLMKLNDEAITISDSEMELAFLGICWSNCFCWTLCYTSCYTSCNCNCHSGGSC